MNYSIIGKHRRELMGISMILIVIYHTSIYLPETLYRFKALTDIGVSMFFFLSGYAMLYSWDKNPDAKAFIIKRLKRIFMTTLPVVFVWCLPQVIIGRIGIGEFVAKCMSIYYWYNGNLLYWFISAIVMLYLLTPGFIALYRKNRKATMTVIGILYVVIVVAGRNGFMNHIIQFSYRFIIYFIGMICAVAAKEEKKIPRTVWIISAILFIVPVVLMLIFKDAVYSAGFRYVAETMMTVFLIITITLILEKIRIDMKISKMLGDYTLEMYLFHEKVLYIFTFIYFKIGIQFDRFGIVTNVLSVLSAFGISIVYKKIIGMVLQK